MYSTSSRFIIRLNTVDWVSLAGLFFSCLASLFFIRHQLALGLSTLLLGMLMDAYDGWIARKLDLQRDFGRYLDGGIDVIMHLFAPALFFYQWGMQSGYCLIVLFIVIAAGIVRLAVFNDMGNIDRKGVLGYLGTPVFWFPFIGAAFFVSGHIFSLHILVPLAAASLCLFAFSMVYRKDRYKPKSLLGITLSLAPAIILLGLWSKMPPKFFDFLRSAFLLASPFIVCGILHMFVVKKDFFKVLKIPIYEPLLGPNKTWRGIFTFIVFTILGVWLAQLLVEPLIEPAPPYLLSSHAALFSGGLLGIVFALGELPNSYLKRRFKIGAGELPTRFKWLVIIGDQLDSALPVAFVYFLLLGMSWVEFIMLIPALAFSFFMIRVLMSAMGLKRSAFQ